MYKTLKLRIKGDTKWLDILAKEVNFVWNYINNLSYYMIRNKSKFLSNYEINTYLSRCTEFNLLTHSMYEISLRYTISRKLHRKRKLRYRSDKKSLGWVPFNNTCVKVKAKKGYLSYKGHKFKVWDSYDLSKYSDYRSGSFNQDSRGRWYINIAVNTDIIDDMVPISTNQVGLDLGLKDLAITSDGEIISNPKQYRQLEEKLGKAQRAKKKDRVRAIHQKIANSRKDYLHKVSDKLTKENSVIVVGDVNSTKLAKTNMAKSVLDTSWGMFKRMLEYKAIRRQVDFIVINEAWTSQTCSECKNRTGPKGLEGLVVREWVCSECNSTHNRDINAAKNILALGLQRLAEGIS